MPLAERVIPLVKVLMPPRDVLLPVLERILYSGVVAEGQAVYDFEGRFKNHFGLPNTLALSSGTAALHVALILAGVQAGGEVISTSMTAEPTNLAILHAGARVVWADIDPESGNLCPKSVREAITSKTQAIVVVHYAGNPARLDELRAVADEFGVPLIEDCAHALGATYGQHPIGTIGDFGIFSFQAIKHLTTIDGGMLTMKDSKHMERARKLRWFGMLKGQPRLSMDVGSVGYKYNMTNVAASIGLVQLGFIDAALERHRENAAYFDDRFSGAGEFRFARTEAQATSAFWIYTLLCDRPEDVEHELVSNGVSASKLHRPNHLHSVFRESMRSLPGVESFYKRLVHIPCGWWVSDGERELIADLVCRA